MTIEIGINRNSRNARLRAEINAERDRRIVEGFVFMGRRFDFDQESAANITGAGASAGVAVAMGAAAGDLRWADPGRDFTFLSRENVPVPMDAQTCFAFSQAAMAHKAAHIFAARHIKDLNPVPYDYTDDRRWPSESQSK